MTLNPERIRENFPALNRPVIFFDNPGGTQIARHALDRMNQYLVECNANHGGNFATSRASDALVTQAREAAADFLNAPSPDEIVLGPNMTTLTFRLSRALGKFFTPGSTLVVTRMDHDANIAPWRSIAEERQLNLRVVDFVPETGMLDMEDFAAALNDAPRLVAVAYASNALGTINPIRRIVNMAHDAGALVYVDAVQYAPHAPIDVSRLGCDFLVCSGYKFFGPHVSVLFGRYELLDRINAYKVRPAPADPPGKFETGTQNFEGIAGLLGALEYLEWVGNEFGSELYDIYAEEYENRRLTYKLAMSAIRSYEYELSRKLLEVFETIPGLRLYGPGNPRHLQQRVPTFSFTLEGYTPKQVAALLGEKGIYVWDGNFYALSVTERLGLEEHGGLIRVGAVHYNTEEEISRLAEALTEITRSH